MGRAKETIYKSDVRMGEKYRDPQTGIEGTVVAICFYQYACERVTIELVVKGEIKEYSFDAPRLESVETGERATATRTGGDRSGIPQAAPPTRR